MNGLEEEPQLAVAMEPTCTPRERHFAIQDRPLRDEQLLIGGEYRFGDDGADGCAAWRLGGIKIRQQARVQQARWRWPHVGRSERARRDRAERHRCIQLNAIARSGTDELRMIRQPLQERVLQASALAGFAKIGKSIPGSLLHVGDRSFRSVCRLAPCAPDRIRVGRGISFLTLLPIGNRSPDGSSSMSKRMTTRRLGERSPDSHARTLVNFGASSSAATCPSALVPAGTTTRSYA